MPFNIQHDEKNHSFYTIVKNKMSTLEYERVDDKTLDYKSTFVPTELRNQGIAGELVKYALDYAKENHLFVIPSCSFVKVYIERHSQYKKLISR